MTRDEKPPKETTRPFGGLSFHHRGGFRTIRLLGEKAQQILARARGKIEEQKDAIPPFTTTPYVPPREPQPISIAMGSLVKAALAIIGVLLLLMVFYRLRGVVMLVALSIFIATVIDPGVSFLERMHVPRGLAVLIVYVLTIAVLLFLLFSLIPVLATQIQQIVTATAKGLDSFLEDPMVELPFLPPRLNAAVTGWAQQLVTEISTEGWLRTVEQFGERLSFAAQSSLVLAANIAGSVLSFVVNLTLVLVFAFFFQIEKEKWSRWILQALPYVYRKYVGVKARAVHEKIGEWIRGQILLCISIGILTFIGLKIVGVPYALTLAVLAGFMEFIPVIGPIIAAIPAVLIATTEMGIVTGTWIVLLYVIIQQLENNIFVPLVMKHAMGLSPVAVLVAVLVGTSFPDTIPPILGIILAVPSAAILSIFAADWVMRKR
jgi:predicted PurR-regulated permease PerM